MTRTLPSARTLANTVDPRTRDYVEALFREELQPIRDRIANLENAISNLRAEIDTHAAETSARLADVDTALSLTAYRAARVRELLGHIPAPTEETR